jgi:hypothetical protein
MMMIAFQAVCHCTSHAISKKTPSVLSNKIRHTHISPFYFVYIPSEHLQRFLSSFLHRICVRAFTVCMRQHLSSSARSTSPHLASILRCPTIMVALDITVARILTVTVYLFLIGHCSSTGLPGQTVVYNSLWIAVWLDRPTAIPFVVVCK